MDVRAELRQALEGLEEPLAPPVDGVITSAKRTAILSRRRRRVVFGAAALAMVGLTGAMLSGLVDEPSQQSPMTGTENPPPQEIRGWLHRCGAAVDPATGHLFVAEGARVVRRASHVIDPTVAADSMAIEVELASGTVMWVLAGWQGDALGGGCDDSSEVESADFDSFVAQAWDGNGIQLP